MEFSHFDCIGFKITDEESFIEMIELVSSKAKKLQNANYENFEYHLYRSPKGIRMYLVTENGELYTLNPHFKGKTSNPVSIISIDVNEAGDGLAFAWLKPDESLTKGLTQINFSCPDYFKHIRSRSPRLVNLQITAFTEEFTIYDTEDEFYEKTTLEIEGKKLQFAKNSFIPIGVFDEQNKSPLAKFAGTIEEIEVVTNPLTNVDFYALRVKSIVDFDVVMPILPNVNLTKGKIIEGIFWMSGIVV